MDSGYPIQDSGKDTLPDFANSELFYNCAAPTGPSLGVIRLPAFAS